jgi:hypothetical protein
VKPLVLQPHYTVRGFGAYVPEDNDPIVAMITMRDVPIIFVHSDGDWGWVVAEVPERFQDERTFGNAWVAAFMDSHECAFKDNGLARGFEDVEQAADDLVEHVRRILLDVQVPA